MARGLANGVLAVVIVAGSGCSTLIGYDDLAFERDDTGQTGSARTSECVPSEAPGPVEDRCGVFVSAAFGDDAAGDGTKSRPFRTLGRGAKDSNTLYTCNTAAFEESLFVEGDVAVFGGLDCDAGWTYAPKKRSEWRSKGGEIAVRVGDLARFLLRDVEIVAADAAAPGGSSIGLLAGSGSTVDLRRCSVTAGRGADAGLASALASAGMMGAPGQQGSEGCVDSVPSTAPGLGGQGSCAEGDVSGGAGGPGLPGGSGADGSDGSPAPQGDGAGEGGKKQDNTQCASGHGGAKGEPGEDGSGAPAKGGLSMAGYTGSPGEDGAPGHAGQGGGGGGGARSCWNGKAGPAGGGGGAGGCGGAGGKGGLPGGASIGIVSLNATLVVSELLVIASDGGKGGDGAKGGPGGMGGLAGNAGGGDPAAAACTGGKGGDGGQGGRGGGGSGGPSIGIAYRGVAPPPTGVEIILGAPGEGGKGESSDHDGATGIAEKVQLLD